MDTPHSPGKVKAEIDRLVASGAIPAEVGASIIAALPTKRLRSIEGRCMGCGRKTPRVLPGNRWNGPARLWSRPAQDGICGACSLLKVSSPREFWQKHFDYKKSVGIDLDTIRSVPGFGAEDVPPAGAAAGPSEVSHGKGVQIGVPAP